MLSQTNKNIGIVGLGSYVPEKILSNTDLERMVDTSDQWIKTRTGIEQRRITDVHTFTSDIASKAALDALEDADMKPEEIELIIVATVTPDMFTPSTACMVQHKIGAVNATAFDVNAACSGFVYALTIANQFITTGYYKNALVIGAETLSKVIDWKDRNTCVLFGDGAGAAILMPTENNFGILATHMGADGSLGKHLTIPSLDIHQYEIENEPQYNPRTIRMDGSEVFKFAVKIMAESTIKVLEKIGRSIDDVNVIIPHQANLRIVDGAAKRLKFDKKKIFTNLQKYGNMSSASIPVALYEAAKEGFIQQGDLVVLVGFGGGLTWGSAVLRWFK
ncbi:MAG: 3-oxoacyl-[acyl-carrier-protein] synthase [Clostridiales bacterium]|jgi:3-oxoacyl-[acyl-carrier-protein] synthase-3|nr:3-oxoacyl-[acyl-carrier-protein] synthase [Clostridiales bacterium]MDK2934272.1 3-oxoacyl-[acyl-carrier-protein] synthase [Clostridiales bacterium]